MSKIMVEEDANEMFDMEDIESIHSDQTDSDELTSDEDNDDVHIPMLRDSDDLDEDDKEVCFFTTYFYYNPVTKLDEKYKAANDIP